MEEKCRGKILNGKVHYVRIENVLKIIHHDVSRASIKQLDSCVRTGPHSTWICNMENWDIFSLSPHEDAWCGLHHYPPAVTRNWDSRVRWCLWGHSAQRQHWDWNPDRLTSVPRPQLPSSAVFKLCLLPPFSFRIALQWKQWRKYYLPRYSSHNLIN